MAKPLHPHTHGKAARAAAPDHDRQLKSSALRALIVGVVIIAAFSAVSIQMIRLASKGQTTVRLAATAPLTTAYSRPDIVDRQGRLLATDVATPSLFANPSRLTSVDETLEALRRILPGSDTPDLRRKLADRQRKFLWIKRGLSTAQAEQLLALGIPGLAFRNEPARIYPSGKVAAHLLGYVDIDNNGVAGIERYINEKVGVERLPIARVNTAPPVRLSIDVAAQNALERELARAMAHYTAKAATGVVMDAQTGEIAAAASLPQPDPSSSKDVLDKTKRNRLVGDAFELGSVFKMVTVAMAMEHGIASPETIVDVTAPLRIGRFRIRDFHPARRPLTLTEVFTKSSNVGAARLALELGGKEQRAFLERLGLTEPLESEIGATPAPKLPRRWGRGATATISYGHGIAIAPLQFAAAAAALVNGGIAVRPTVLARSDGEGAATWQRQVVSAQTSARIRDMMRQNVISGSGRRASVAGYDVGGKTGTAEWANDGTYDGKSVINSFIAAFPISRPRYVVFVTIFDPKPAKGRRSRTAGLNAAVAAGRIIKRVAPLLGVLPGKEAAGR